MNYSVLYVFDNNYAPYAGVSICSILENALEGESFTIYTLMDRVTEENKNLFKKLEAKYNNVEIIQKDCSDFSKNLKETNPDLVYRGSIAAMLRLFYVDFIKEGTKQLLYLDCDTLVLGSIRDFFESGAKSTKSVSVILDSVCGYYKTTIGFDMQDQYFNSGVILFDVDRWIANGYEEKVLELIKSHNSANPDQDILNVVLKDDKNIVPLKYNYQPFHSVYSNKQYFRAHPHDGYYSEDEISESSANPVILHCYRFLGQFPWHENTLHPDKERFYVYLNKSPWGSVFKPVANTKFLFKVERVLFRILPKGAFVVIFKAFHNLKFKMQDAKRKH